MRAKLHERATALGRDDGAAYVVAKASGGPTALATGVSGALSPACSYRCPNRKTGTCKRLQGIRSTILPTTCPRARR